VPGNHGAPVRPLAEDGDMAEYGAVSAT
jgi:hypothetical protein